MPRRNGRKQNAPLTVGDRVRAKTTRRIGEVTNIANDGSGAGDRLRVEYDTLPQDEFLTTPARDGVELPRELIDRV